MKSGFTLAEVLITLAIIGVVAALTIPTVVRNYQKQQTVVKLKKVYSALSNTTNLAIADNGPITGWQVGASDTGQAAVDFANTYLIPYLKVSKNCENKTTGECEFKITYLSRSYTFSSGSGSARFFLNDGTFVTLSMTNNPDIDWAQKFAVVYIDINGQKKPNLMGRDIFNLMYIVESRNGPSGIFIPNGIYNSREFILSDESWSCNKNSAGGRCAALIIKDGWQIKDDYPW